LGQNKNPEENAGIKRHFKKAIARAHVLDPMTKDMEIVKTRVRRILRLKLQQTGSRL
jgi:hypothetical protein